MQHRRNALVTGSTSGIGLAIANELAVRGMNIVLNGFGAPAEVETLRQCLAEAHGVDVFFEGADMSRQGDIEAMLTHAAERFGGVDVLINNAGIPLRTSPSSSRRIAPRSRCAVYRSRCSRRHRTHVAFRLHCTRGPVLVIGTDCPVLRPEQLRIAAQALIDGDDAVFYPTDDGGYAAVGLRRPQAGLFVDMTSGTADVMSQARGRAHALGLRVREPETLWNVSVPADLARLDALGLGAAP